MKIPIRIGMDTAKSVFQLHGVDENEIVVVRRQFRRSEMIRYFERLPPLLVAIESSAKTTSRWESNPGGLRVPRPVRCEASASG